MVDHDAIFKALANPLRRQILDWLREAQSTPESFGFPLGISVSAIQARTGLSQSTVSNHVASLQRAKLVEGRRVGQWLFLSRNESIIRKFVCTLPDII